MEACRSYSFVLKMFNILMQFYLSRILLLKHQHSMEQCSCPFYLAVTRRQFLSELATTRSGHYMAQLVIFTTMCVERMAQVLFLSGFWQFRKVIYNRSVRAHPY